MGLGWNLNVGAVNRQVRGIPDDMMGNAGDPQGDNIITEHYTKPKVTVGGRLRTKLEFSGQGLFHLNGSVTYGVFSDNYTGMGAEVGINSGISVSTGHDGTLTAGLGVGILSNTASGVDLTPYANLSISDNVSQTNTVSAGFSASLGYNSRSGMKSLTLGKSFSVSGQEEKLVYNPAYFYFPFDVETSNGSANFSIGGSTVSYNTEPIQPKVNYPYVSHYDSFSFDVGPALYFLFPAEGGSGYRTVREVQTPSLTVPTFGFLYAQNGKNVRNAQMDFIREKDNPVIPELPNLAIPVSTPDLFTYTSQVGGGEFRLYRGGTGVFFDNEVTNKDYVTSIGGDVGIGSLVHGGVTLFKQNGYSTTRKWTQHNNYLPVGDFQDEDRTNPGNQHVYFKQVGEKNAEDADMANQLNGKQTLAVQVGETTAMGQFDGYPQSAAIRKHNRQAAGTSISYLTAREAAIGGLDKSIPYYDVNNYGSFIPTAEPQNGHTVSRIGGSHKSNHFSQISVTDREGKRMVYGVPVYQNFQTEYTFAAGARGNGYPTSGNRNDQVSLPQNITEAALGRDKGIDHYYHKETHPGYATSFLLSAVLSPDYVDKTGNGISDDDLGTAIKFNYSKLSYNYRWRTPYQSQSNVPNATLNKGLLADPDDDKASIVYGEKELWYLHSVESKTKIAYFITDDRNDGLGVVDFLGQPNTAARQKRLREIRLYSKLDMSKPIKVVHFVYDYSLCPNTPNSIASEGAQNGKLTLKKIYFTYGNTTKGENFPYQFSYAASYTNGAGVATANTGYNTQSTDRWGTYKDPADNTYMNLPNDQFPYTAQDLYGDHPEVTSRAAQAAALWHLNQISLPTGGTINVSYEADDYAYVQDKKAMVMSPVADLLDSQQQPMNLSSSTPSGGLAGAGGIKIQVTSSPGTEDPTSWFKKNYLNGSDYIYGKFFTKVSTSDGTSDDNFDFIPCYAEIDHVTVSGNYAFLALKGRSDKGVTANPYVFSAWQRIKDDYPRYAYPGFDQRAGDESIAEGVANAVRAILDAFGNLRELTQNFYQKAQSKRYGDMVQLNKSFVRLVKQDGHKIGGGLRVQKITMDDGWNNVANNVNKTYGQQYVYTTTEDNKQISSGVASYEPTVGGDENPLRQPVPYMQKIKGGIDNFFELEEPFGESFFPAPSVVYSKVTVTDLDGGQSPTSTPQTGFVVNEFYTARDFPVKVSATRIQPYENRPASKYDLVETTSIDELTLSQGYAIELNDMHGKGKAVRIYNQSGAEISSVVYHYNTTVPSSGPLSLANLVNIVNQDGSVSQNRVIGRDIEFFTDFREQESVNEGKSINIGFDQIPFIPFPIPHFPINDNSEYKLFRSACAVKVTQYFGVIDKVVKTDHGSSITTQNIAYDGATGEPIVTQTQNEFGKNLYSVHIPAYWGYGGMGPAYQNQDAVLAGLSTSAQGGIAAPFNAYLNSGDELIDLSSSSGDGSTSRYWVTQQMVDLSTYQPGSITGEVAIKFIIDKFGRVQLGKTFSLVKVIRSGARNLLAENMTDIVCLNNPIVTNPTGGGLMLAMDGGDLTSTLKVINASSRTYDENWASDIPDIHVVPGNPPYDLTIAGGSSGSQTNGTYLWNGKNYQNTNFSYSATSPASRVQSNFFDNRLSQCAISDNNHALIGPDNSNIMGIYASFFIPVAKTYYIGFDSNIDMSFAFDCNDWVSVFSRNNACYFGWNIIAQDFTAGWHTIKIELTYDGHDPTKGGINNCSFEGGGIEIYNNSSYEIQNAGDLGANLNILFSTAKLIGSTTPAVYVVDRQNGTFYNQVYTDGVGTGYTPCSVPNKAINPFLFGLLGNWRPYQSYVLQQNRVYNNAQQPKAGLNVAGAGYINHFYGFWQKPQSGTGSSYWTNNNSGNWVLTNTSMLFDKYGQEIENMDALKRHNAAKFDFNGELPGAVASNARSREIYANSFEDAGFSIGAYTYLDPPPTPEFVGSSDAATISRLRTTADAHTGNYALKLPASGITLVTSVNSSTNDQKPVRYMDVDNKYQFTKSAQATIYPIGFQPMCGNNSVNANSAYNRTSTTSYLFDVWVKDGLPAASDASLKLAVTGPDGVQQPCNMTPKAVVEGWKLLEGTFDLNKFSDGNQISIGLLPADPSNGNILVDDIRIHPVTSQMKSYVYNASTLKLAAELDENSFATFYEYDSEGQLIRVKKETERGIMTIKESRSSNRRTP